MTWDDRPAGAAMAPPGSNPTNATVATQPNGFRRAILTAGMAAALLVTGGVAIVAAASPEPSASANPGATNDPSSGATTDSSRGDRLGRDGGPCPDENRGSSGSGGSSGSDNGQSATPSPDTATPTPGTATPLT
jgi:hypothetical protein